MKIESFRMDFVSNKCGRIPSVHCEQQIQTGLRTPIVNVLSVLKTGICLQFTIWKL